MAELLMVCTWLTNVFQTVFLYMLNVGTNLGVVKFVMGNILLITIVAYLTPSKRDNKFVEWLKTTISNYKKKDPKE